MSAKISFYRDNKYVLQLVSCSMSFNFSQANHWFEDGANVVFEKFLSPRFGTIGCLKSKRAIARGEEIFADYSYETASAPRWYQRMQKELGIPERVKT